MDAKELWESPKARGSVPLSEDVPVIKARTSMDGILFTLARYKFVIRMLQPRRHSTVLELGCNNGFGTRYVRNKCEIDKLVGVDFDSEAISVAREEVSDDICEFIEDDFIGKDYRDRCSMGGYTCVFAMDVIEHIPRNQEQDFVDTMADNLAKDGFVVIGTPNVTMYPYASPWNKARHINNYSPERLHGLLSTRFEQVFLFGMNDESLNTGFYPMNCYVLVLACQKK